MKRVLSAVVFLPIFWVIVKKLGLWPYDLLIVTAAMVALYEVYRLARAAGHRCHLLLGALLMLCILNPRSGPVSLPLEGVLATGLFILPLASLRRGGDWRPALGDVATSFFGATFIGVLFGYLLRLRGLDDLPKGEETGSDLVFLLFLVVWSGDIAAFYVGTFLGRRPLAPRVSPKKTIEGAVGGLAGSIAAAFVARAWFMTRLSFADCLILGTALALVGMLGDLVESMLKRGAGVKDSASLVPGHGGILDRVDSLLYAGPVLYYYYLFAMGSF
jgi:phosphatidate cytidylyltransferase